MGEVESTGQPAPGQEGQEMIDGALDEHNVGLSLTEVLLVVIIAIEAWQLSVQLKGFKL